MLANKKKMFWCYKGIIFPSKDNLSAYVIPHWIFFSSSYSVWLVFPNYIFQMRFGGRVVIQRDEDDRKLINHQTIFETIEKYYNFQQTLLPSKGSIPFFISLLLLFSNYRIEVKSNEAKILSIAKKSLFFSLCLKELPW